MYVGYERKINDNDDWRDDGWTNRKSDSWASNQKADSWSTNQKADGWSANQKTDSWSANPKADSWTNEKAESLANQRNRNLQGKYKYQVKG